jgi:hypothetical protein
MKMSPMAGFAGGSPLVGKPGTPGTAPAAVQVAHAAKVGQTERPVAPVEAGKRPAKLEEENPGSAARRTLAAAVRAAMLREMRAEGMRAVATADGEEEAPRQAGRPVPALVLGELMARVTSRAILPLLPEPPTPAREAFAEAIVALRSGIRRNGMAEGSRA